MIFPFGNENYIFCRNSMEVEIAKEKYRKSFKGDFFGKLNFTTLESFIKEESIIYWPLVEDKIRVNVLSRNASICVLESIIRDKKDFDAYFQGVNSNSFFLATQIYSIMLKSVKNNIPVEAISERIGKFKRSIYPQKVFLDIDSIIKSYRTVMNKYKVIDIAMLIENYLKKIYPSNVYQENIKNKKFYIYKANNNSNFKDSIEEIYSLETTEKEFDIVNINKIIEESCVYEKNESIEIYEKEFENYFDMLFYLEEKLGNIIDDKVYKKSNICIIVAKTSSIIENVIKDLSLKLDTDIRFLSNNYDVRNSSIAISSLFALALKMDMQYVFNDDEKIEFVKLILEGIYNNKNSDIDLLSEDLYEEFDNQIYESMAIENNPTVYTSELIKEKDQIFKENIKGDSEIDTKEYTGKEALEDIKSKEIYNLEKKDINYISIRKNLNIYIREIRETEGILPSLSDENHTGFIKKFYRKYAELNEESINEISKICKLIDELSIFSEKSSGAIFSLRYDDMIKFIKEYMSNFTSMRRKIENKDLGNILLTGYAEYLNSSIDSSIKIILDAKSIAFDASIESEIDTDLAYMDDSILSNIDGENIDEFYRDYQEKAIVDDICKLIGNNGKKDEKVYILSSYNTIAGYEQENRFLNIFHEIIKNNYN